ncbi:MAG: hypothetical protein ACXIT9_06650 [Nitritalea sp.]
MKKHWIIMSLVGVFMALDVSAQQLVTGPLPSQTSKQAEVFSTNRGVPNITPIQPITPIKFP